MKATLQQPRGRTCAIPRLPAARRAGSALFSPAGWQALARQLDLSGRELSILKVIFDNQVEYAVAQDLGIAPRTVHTHLERLHRKLGVTSRTQLLTELMAEYLRLTESAEGNLPSICAHRSAGDCPLRSASSFMVCNPMTLLSAKQPT